MRQRQGAPSPVPRIPWSAVPFPERPWLAHPERYVVSFTTELPFGLALDEQWRVSLEQPHELEAVTVDQVSVTFYPAEEPPALPGYFSLLPDFEAVLADFGDRALPVSRTICEFVTHPAERWELSALVMSRSFDQGLNALNRILAEYAIETMDWTVREVAKEDLPAIALVSFKDLEAPWYAHQFLRLHDLDGLVKEPLPEELRRRVAQRAAIVTSEGDIRAFHRHRTRADRSPDQGRYAETVIEASMAIEAYVVWILNKRAEESGEPARAGDLLERHGLRRVLSQQMHEWLGGHWDITRPGTPLNQWYADLHELRNRCVHAGYRPNHREARAAILAGKALTDYFKERLQATGRGAWVEEGRARHEFHAITPYRWEDGSGEPCSERADEG